MKAALFVLSGFCLAVGAMLSLTASNEFMSWWMLTWGVGSFFMFGVLGVTFPERV